MTSSWKVLLKVKAYTYPRTSVCAHDNWWYSTDLFDVRSVLNEHPDGRTITGFWVPVGLRWAATLRGEKVKPRGDGFDWAPAAEKC